ncbi:MAG: hypothetical protein ACE5D7_02015 [Fidelibacterota bacterium]
MSAFNPDKEIKNLICDQMGDDIDAEACEQLKQYMEECPECKIFFDSVNKMVKLYRNCEEEKEIPEDVSRRLFRVLNLKKA